MSALPTELDFDRDRSATPERMNQAMDYLLRRLRAVESVTPNLEAIIAELRAFGIGRVAEAITPIRQEVVQIRDELRAILDAAEDETLPDLVVARAKTETLLLVYSKAEADALLADRALATNVYDKATADDRFAAKTAFDAAAQRLVPVGGAIGLVLTRTGEGAADYAWAPQKERRWEFLGAIQAVGPSAQFSNIPARFDDFLLTFQDLAFNASSGSTVTLERGLSSDGATWTSQVDYVSPSGITGHVYVINRAGPNGASFYGAASQAQSTWSLVNGVNALRIRPQGFLFTGGTVRLFAR